MLQPNIASLADYLTEDRIKHFTKSLSQRQIIADLLNTMQLPNADFVLNILCSQGKTTMIGEGIASIYAYISGIQKIEASLGICAAGIKIPSEKCPIQLIVVFLRPVQTTQDADFLACLLSLSQIKGLSQALISSKSSSDAIAAIRESEKNYRDSFSEDLGG